MNLKFAGILATTAVVGLTSCTKNTGEVSFTYQKGTAEYGNLQAVRNTTLAESPRPTESIGKIFYGENIVLIGDEQKGIHVYDNSIKTSPRKVSFINLPFVGEFYLDGDILYAESHYDVVKIDLSDKVNPVLLNRAENAISEPIVNEQGSTILGFRYQTETANYKLGSAEEAALRKNNMLYFDYNNTLIPESTLPASFVGTGSGKKGTANRMDKIGDHLYVLGSENLYTLQTNNGLNLVNKRNVGWDLETIYSDGDRLFIGSNNSMKVLDASNPSNPTDLSTYNHPNTCDPVLPHGDVAYLTLRSLAEEGCAGNFNALEVIDITNVRNPNQLKMIDMPSPYGMSIAGDVLFVAQGANGFTLYDISNANDPIKLSSSATVTYDVVAHPTTAGVFLTTNGDRISQIKINPDNSAQALSDLPL